MKPDLEEAKARIKELVRDRLDLSSDISDEELMELIDEAIYMLCRETQVPLLQREYLRKSVFNSMRRFGILQELLEDDSITEIMINGYKHIFIERDGRITLWEKCFGSRQDLEDVAQRIAAWSNRMVNETEPILDTRLSDGSRVNIVLNPISIDGPTITVRKFYETPLTVESLIKLGSITEEAAAFMRDAVRAKYNIFVSGGTGSGKTTFLNALSNYIPEDERIITIEDSAELQINDINKTPRNLVRLETRQTPAEVKTLILGE